MGTLTKLEPIQRLALHVFGWAVLTGLSFFFHVVAFLVVGIILAYKAKEFEFVYSNTKNVVEDMTITEEESHAKYYQPELPYPVIKYDGQEVSWPWRRSKYY